MTDRLPTSTLKSGLTLSAAPEVLPEQGTDCLCGGYITDNSAPAVRLHQQSLLHLSWRYTVFHDADKVAVVTESERRLMDGNR